MITLDRDHMCFNYRVAGVAIHDGMVLLHRNEHENFWTLPGGRCEMCEKGAVALRREMAEEIGADVVVDRLLWVVENFFEYGGRNCHEIGFYFLMNFPGDTPFGWGGEPFIGHEGALHLIFQWHPLEQLGQLPIYPTFLRERIGNIGDVTEHIVHDDKPRV